MSTKPMRVDLADTKRRLDGVVQLWLLLSAVGLPIAHLLLHRLLFTVRPYWTAWKLT